MRRFMLFWALSAGLLATTVNAEPNEGRNGWHDRDRIERHVNRDRDRINRDRDLHNRELDRRNRELDRAKSEQRHQRHDHDRHDNNRRDHDRHDQGWHERDWRADNWRREQREQRRDFWARERAWQHHHRHSGHWDAGIRFYVFENRRYNYHPYFGDSDPFVRDEYGNCYRVEYYDDRRVLTQVRSKYCRWS